MISIVSRAIGSRLVGRALAGDSQHQPVVVLAGYVPSGQRHVSAFHNIC
jgi:hypothetical protein